MFKWFKKKVSREEEVYNKIQEDGIEYSSVISYLEYVDPGDEGRVFPISCKNGRKGWFRIISLTPCADWGSRNVKVLFEGYEGEKSLKDLTLEEFIEGDYIEMFRNCGYK